MIENIFSVPIYVGKVLKNGNISQILSDIDLEKETRSTEDENTANKGWACNVKTGHAEEELETSSWHETFIDAIAPNVYEYVETIKLRNDYDISIGIPWVNYYEKGNSQEEHCHVGESVLSYAYIHKFPENSGNFYFKNVLGKNQFFGQKQGFLHTVNSHYAPSLGEGCIVIFPAWLDHGVTPNRSNDVRISISGNIALIN